MRHDLGKCEICGRRAAVIAKIGLEVTLYTRDFGARDRVVCWMCSEILSAAIGEAVYRYQFGGPYVA
jgi:hypothetical protein